MRAILVGIMLLLAIAPVTAGLPPPPPPGERPILAVHEPGDATISGLVAAGFSPCDPAFPTGFCFEAVEASDLASVTFSDHRVVFVGTHDGGQPVYNALVARKADLESYLANGGALIALAEPATGEYAFVPTDVAWPFYLFETDPSDDVWVTPYGSTHPALVGVTNASISDWAPSYSRTFGERPNYLAEIIRGEAYWAQAQRLWRGSVGLSGNWGDGCVLITLLQADRVASGLHDPDAAPDAAGFLRAILDWGLDCGVQPPAPWAHSGWARISRGGPIGGPAPSAAHSPNLDCAPLTLVGSSYVLECMPIGPVPPNFYPACVGTAAGVWHTGLSGFTATSECGGSASATCSTTPVGGVGSCSQMAGIELADFPFRCIATPGSATVANPTWLMVCGSTDP